MKPRFPARYQLTIALLRPSSPQPAMAARTPGQSDPKATPSFPLSGRPHAAPASTAAVVSRGATGSPPSRWGSATGERPAPASFLPGNKTPLPNDTGPAAERSLHRSPCAARSARTPPTAPCRTLGRSPQGSARGLALREHFAAHAAPPARSRRRATVRANRQLAREELCARARETRPERHQQRAASPRAPAYKRPSPSAHAEPEAPRMPPPSRQPRPAARTAPAVRRPKGARAPRHRTVSRDHQKLETKSF